MKAPTLVACGTMLVLIVPLTSGDAPETFEYHLDLGPEMWAALRVNITSGHDLSVGSQTRYCTGTGSDYRAVVAGAAWALPDNVPRIYAITPGDVIQGFFAEDNPLQYSDVATLSVAGTGVATPTSDDEEYCLGIGDGQWCRSCTSAVAETYIVAYAAMGQRTTFDFRGQWTRGVLSHDVAWGPLYAAKHGVSQEGAEASVYVPFAPSAWVAAASRHVTHTEGDALGFFTPESRFSFGETDWSCSRNGSPCDLTARFESVYDLQATEPSTWDFRINASARLSSSPGYYLSLIEFPDDTWIR